MREEGPMSATEGLCMLQSLAPAGGGSRPLHSLWEHRVRAGASQGSYEQTRPGGPGQAGKEESSDCHWDKPMGAPRSAAFEVGLSYLLQAVPCTSSHVLQLCRVRVLWCVRTHHVEWAAKASHRHSMYSGAPSLWVVGVVHTHNPTNMLFPDMFCTGHGNW